MGRNYFYIFGDKDIMWICELLLLDSETWVSLTISQMLWVSALFVETMVGGMLQLETHVALEEPRTQRHMWPPQL